MLKRVLFGLAALVITVHFASSIQAKDDPKGQQVICPVMGQPVKDPGKAAKSEYKGKTYYFCCPSCKEKFDKNPEKYVGKAAQSEQGHEGSKHTCGGSSGCDHKGH